MQAIKNEHMTPFLTLRCSLISLNAELSLCPAPGTGEKDTDMKTSCCFRRWCYGGLQADPMNSLCCLVLL